MAKCDCKHRNHKCFTLFLAVLAFALCLRGQGTAEGAAEGTASSEQLYSELAGQVFYELGWELANSENASVAQMEQGMIFLSAVMKLGSPAKHVVPDMIRLAARIPQADYSELMRRLLSVYVDQSADLDVAREGISYLFGRLNSREEREKLLEELLKNFGGKNKGLDSELAFELGLLKAEKADLQSAQSYFIQAYYNNRYNKPAFAKLAELAGERIGAATYLEHLRSAIEANPLDMEAGMAFAQYAERLQLYQTAAEAYEYCVNLYKYLRPGQALPAQLYLPWAISCYNTQRNQHKCVQIASEVRNSGRFDLFVEGIAGRAAGKIGDAERANQILKSAEQKALELAAGYREFPDQKTRTFKPEELAWFYCFAAPDANKAVEWANRAYASEPNSANAASILAWALVVNGQGEWAKLLIDNYPRNQITELALGQIQLAGGQKGAGIETLKSAIARDAGSLAAERARAILAQEGTEYIAPTDAQAVLSVLRDKFPEGIVPEFLSPEKIISAQLKLRGSKFSYGSDFEGVVAINSRSSRPLVIFEDGLFKGNIRVDAKVSGDIEKEIAKAATVKVRPGSAVQPGASFFVPVRLFSGELKRILSAHPQASVNVEFTVFLDPVVAEGGRIANSLGDVKPAQAVVERRGIELNSKYLQNRLDSLSQGRQGQKIKSGELFAGLLMEQQSLGGGEPPYKLMYADWMPELLKSALVRNLGDDDWVVKVHTMAAMAQLRLDYQLMSAAGNNLNDSHWPVRLIAVFLLARAEGGNFQQVLDWTAKYDSSVYVRQMALALGGKEPPPKQALPDTTGEQR